MTNQNFWGSKNTVAWFRDEPAPQYWVDFFKGLDRKQFSKVLDLGCGAGRNSEMLVDLGYDLYSCDLEPSMVKETLRRLRNKFPIEKWEARIIVASMLALPYPQNNFDAIISNGAYHNTSSVEDMNQAIFESSRVLHHDGFICFNLFSSKYIATELKLIPEKPYVYLTAEGLDMTLVTPEKFLALAIDNGLELIGQLAEYEREVSTGKRAVMRGVLRKI